MRFFQVLLSGAALVAAALAVEFNSVPSSIEPGKTYTITWSPPSGTVSLILRKGDPNNLDTITTLTTTGAGGSFQWTVPSTLPNANDYALEIKPATGPSNFSGQIKLSGSTASASASSSVSATSSSSSASSSASSSKSSSASASITSSSSSSASASVSSTPGANSTISSATLTKTTSGTASATTTGSSPPNQSNAAILLGSSPVALILGAVAAIAYL